MGVSVSLITYNEEELLPYCLTYLCSIRNVSEICVTDSFSTDRTVEIIKDFAKQDFQSRPINFTQNKFETFPQQRQLNFDLATQDWIWMVDADETFSGDMDVLFDDLKEMPHINAARFRTIVMYQDRKHMLSRGGDLSMGVDPHIKVVRRGFTTYRTGHHKVLEDLRDINGREMHTAQGPDILNTYEHEKYQLLCAKHHLGLKSKNALLNKGRRWKELGMIDEACRLGIPIYETWWADHEERVRNSPECRIEPLPKEYWDITTEM